MTPRKDGMRAARLDVVEHRHRRLTLVSGMATRRPTVPAAPRAESSVPVVPERRVSVRHDVRARLARARAFERTAPEEWGFKLSTAMRLFTVTGWAYRYYFRTQCFGIERLPRGAVMLIANHGSHVLAWDGANIITACLLEANPPRLVHGMAHHRLMKLPIIGRHARQIGAADGRRETAVRMLRGGSAVLAFPEGMKALHRSFKERYKVLPFGHGFVHAALAADAPIVPVAVIGAEEEAPTLANPSWLRRALGTPTAGISPTLFVPLPVRYRLHFGQAYRPTGPATEANVAAHVEHLHRTLQSMVDRGRADRSHVFY
jgi:1-acyl-sn-glycerol-3-phosphate acyltransferase